MRDSWAVQARDAGAVETVVTPPGTQAEDSDGPRAGPGPGGATVAARSESESLGPGFKVRLGSWAAESDAAAAGSLSVQPRPSARRPSDHCDSIKHAGAARLHWQTAGAIAPGPPRPVLVVVSLTPAVPGAAARKQPWGHLPAAPGRTVTVTLSRAQPAA